MTEPECNGMCLMGNEVMPGGGHYGQDAVAHPECPRHGPPSALSLLTEVQRDAVIATAAAYLLDPEDLAAEWLPMLSDQPTDPVIRPEPGDELAVKDALTAPTEPEPAGATAYTVSFTTAPPTTWRPYP